MLHINTKQNEIVCWSIAFGLHCMLLLWKASPYKIFEADPIISIDFIIEEVQPLGYQAQREADSGGLFRKIKKMLGFADKVRQQAISSDQLATGDLSQKIQSNTRLKDFKKQPNLIDKKKKTTFKGFGHENLSSSSEELKSAGASPIQVASKNKLDAKSTQDLSDKTYQVAKRDLPFEIARAPSGRLATGSIDGDAPVVSVGKKTSRSVRDISTKVADKGSYSGGGSGGSLSGTGEFSNIATSKGGGGGSPRGSLAGSGDGSYGTPAIGKGKSYGGSSASGSRGFSGVGSTSGGVAGGELGEGSPLAAGGGGTGSKKGGGGGNKALFELSGPLSNRQIFRQVIPSYPEWAKKKGIIARVSLYFFVLHTGVVKDTIVIQRTSGYPRLDKTAMDALIKWKFAPLPKAQYGKEQWGIITFKFKIR